MKAALDTDHAFACTSKIEAIGMIAFGVVVLALSTRLAALPAPLKMPVPRLALASELVRVRVQQLRSKEFSLSGMDLVVNGRLLPGYHAYKFKKFVSAQDVSWSARDRDGQGELKLSGDLKITGTDLRMNLKPVPDSLEIRSRALKTSDVIATLELETYLRGVLPSEMPASWPIEALKAQAIAARTFALFRKTHQSHDGFDLDSDVSDQMFLNDAPSTSKAERALRETNGMVLEDLKHQPFAAYFHADCGGRTEEARNVWGAGDSTGVAIDSGCPLNPRATWTLRLTLKQLSDKLGTSVTNVAAGVRSPSGRLSTIELALNDGKKTSWSGNDFRTALGFDQLKSTQFTIAREGDVFVFKGRGYGHGVGLCQWGARQMAKAGRTYKEILSHYYPKAMLAVLDRHPNLNDEERDGANDEQAAQFHDKSLPRSLVSSSLPKADGISKRSPVSLGIGRTETGL